jgi:ceramide glucosyltransferase
VAPVATEPRGFVAELEAAFFNGGGARWLIAAGRLGYGTGVGQTMLMRRADIERAGGLDVITSGFCEDAALATAIRKLSLSVRMAPRPGWHPIGRRRFVDLWQRHLRWQCCRKYHTFPVFLCEPSVTPLATAIAGGLFWSAITDISWIAIVAGHLVASLVLEAAYLRRQGWPMSWRSPAAWLIRDLLIPALWLRALTARTLMWRGTRLQLPPLLAAGRQRRL